MKKRIAQILKKYSKWISVVGQIFFLLSIPYGIWNSIVTREYTEIIASLFFGLVGALVWSWGVRKWIDMM